MAQFSAALVTTTSLDEMKQELSVAMIYDGLDKMISDVAISDPIRL